MTSPQTQPSGQGSVGEEFGPYTLNRLIGRGGMGEVFEAHDREQDRRVALKRLVPEMVDDEDFRKRFQRESRLAARLSSPHVIPIHRSGEIEGRLFLDMRLVDGWDLEQVLTSETRLAPERAVTVVEGVASALDAAHHAGLVHRDIKPPNVLLDRAVGANEFVYLVDFGVTRPVDGDSQLITASNAVVGSLDYMAPEQFDGTTAPSADIYALGCLLFHCLTGRPPFDEDSFAALMHAHVTRTPPAPSTVYPTLGAGFDDVVATALAKDPTARPATAGALARAARMALGTAPPDDDATRAGPVSPDHTEKLRTGPPGRPSTGTAVRPGTTGARPPTGTDRRPPTGTERRPITAARPPAGAAVRPPTGTDRRPPTGTNRPAPGSAARVNPPSVPPGRGVAPVAGPHRPAAHPPRAGEDATANLRAKAARSPARGDGTTTDLRPSELGAAPPSSPPPRRTRRALLISVGVLLAVALIVAAVVLALTVPVR